MDLRGANENLIEVFSAKKITASKRAMEVALAVSTGTAENDGASSELLLVDRDKKAQSSFSAKAMLSKGFAETTGENVFQKAAAYCVPTR